MFEANLFADSIRFFVNGDEKRVGGETDPRQTLLEYLRNNGYSGTKCGCNEGGCGACTVLIAEFDSERKKVLHRTANSCLLPVLSLNNKQVVTVEGIGNTQKPHPVQVSRISWS